MPMRSKFIALDAPAKLNVSLAVGRRQPDGYHLIESLMVPLSLHDDVRLQPSGGGIEVAVSGPTAGLTPTDRTNLVWRAAELLAAEAGRPADVRIELVKRIPVAGGLGGGSSDAGATLVGLNRLWGLDWPIERLAGLAAQLGSDVPFCVYRRPSWVRGRGEIVEPLAKPLPPLHVLLLLPDLAVSTREVYQQLDAFRDELSVIITNKCTAGGVVFSNDLEGPALEVCPPLARLFETLDQPAGVPRLMVAGSGSTLFAPFETRAEACQCEQRVRSLADCRTAVASFLPEATGSSQDTQADPQGDCNGHQRSSNQAGGQAE